MSCPTSALSTEGKDEKRGGLCFPVTTPAGGLVPQDRYLLGTDVAKEMRVWFGDSLTLRAQSAMPMCRSPLAGRSFVVLFAFKPVCFHPSRFEGPFRAYWSFS